MTADEAKTADLSTKQVAQLLGMSRDSVLRIDPAELDYWTTPGRFRPHRKYRRADVEAYAMTRSRTHPGRGTNATQPRHKAQGT